MTVLSRQVRVLIENMERKRLNFNVGLNAEKLEKFAFI